MTNLQFVKKWNGKKLLDTGSYVSKDFSTFQNAFKRQMKTIAEDMGATLVSFNKGHYYMSGFIEKNGHYVYFCYSRIWNRSTPNLMDNGSMYVRTAKDAKDFRGGMNHNISFYNCPTIINKLINTEHQSA